MKGLANTACGESDAGSSFSVPRLGSRPALNGIRGAAAVLIITDHAGMFPGSYIGVTVFFVLSGFLITTFLLEEVGRSGSIDFPMFYMRRALRLLPALFLMVAIVATYAMATGSSTNTLRAVIPTLFYFENWNTIGSPSLLTHAWSLAIEEQFYLLWPVALAALLRWKGRDGALTVTLALAVSLIALRAVLIDSGVDGDRLIFGSDTRGDALLVGCVAAMIRTKGSRLPPLSSWFGLGVLGVVVATPVPFGLALTLSALAAAPVVLAAANSHRLFESRFLQTAGRLSYGLYLWNFPVSWLLFANNGVFAGMTGPVALAILLPLSWTLAWLSYQFIESPFLRLKSKYQPAFKAEVSGAHARSAAQLGADAPALS